MKKIFLSFAVAIVISSCGNSSSETSGGTGTGDAKATETKDAAADDLSGNPVYQKGLSLVAKSDCLTCHKIDDKLTGPSYRDVANKYAGMPDTIVTHLAGKILKGGNGVWGEAYMTPHAAVSQEDAEAMVKYIMLLKK